MKRSMAKSGMHIVQLIDMYPAKRIKGPREYFKASLWDYATMFTYWMRMEKGYRARECRQMLLDGGWNIPGNENYFKRVVSEKTKKMRLVEQYQDGSLGLELDRMRKELFPLNNSKQS